MLALKFPTPGFQKSSANTTVEAAVRVKPGNREANKCSIVSCSKGCAYMPMYVCIACMHVRWDVITAVYVCTSISSGDREHSNQTLLIMLESVTVALSQFSRSAAINANVIMLLQ